MRWLRAGPRPRHRFAAAAGSRATGRRLSGLSSHIALVALQFAALASVGHAQVRNLRFVDEDTSSGKLGGIVYWEKPAAGDDGMNYAVFLSIDNTGGTKTQLPLGAPYDLPGGAGTSAFILPSNTAKGGNTHLFVYLKDVSGTLSNAAYICVTDNPGDLVRTVYATTTGYTKANNMRTKLVTDCHASYESIVVEMATTAKWSGSVVTETAFDDANEQSGTAAFSVTFPTGTSFANIETAINSYVGDAPLPAVFTGTNSDSAYSLGTVQAKTVMDKFNPERPDTDIARYIARSCIEYKIAGAVIVNRMGMVRIQTKADKQTAVSQMANVYLNKMDVSYTNLGGATSTKNAIAAQSTASQALCYQVTGADSQPSCLRASSGW